MALISPGVEVTVTDESFYTVGTATALPLIFITTAAEKTQNDGITPALGTYENNVLRVVTSVREALSLYGTPTFYESADGQPHHGDARNEYGLDALIKFLEVGNRAFVVRANINTNDSYVDLKQIWQQKTKEAASLLNLLVEEYILAYNNINELFPIDPEYKRTVDGEELISLTNEAMITVFNFSSFSDDNLNLAFNDNHRTDRPGFQDVLFNTGNGFIQETDITTLIPSERYTAVIRLSTSSGFITVPLDVLGSEIPTFGDLMNYIATMLGTNACIVLIGGRLRIINVLSGASSFIDIIQDGSTDTLPLFRSLLLFHSIPPSITGRGPSPLLIYDDSFTNIVGEYDGFEYLATTWESGNTVIREFTPDEAEGLLLAAAADFDNTREFRNLTRLGANDNERRIKIVTALQQTIINRDSGIYSETIEYNLVVAPGFNEVDDDLLRLSDSMRNEVFVIGEIPVTFAPSGLNSVRNWSDSPRMRRSVHIGYWYGHGITSNIDGKNILTTGASTALRTIAYSDSIAELWLAPAGATRGVCSHLEDIGYVTGALGGPTTFVSAPLDTGQRDELYSLNINPITFLPGRGILVMGQKTASPNKSALDRINVSRLLKFISRELRKSLFSYLFEPNDSFTRSAVKFTADAFLTTLVTRRGLYDFATICDSSNNDVNDLDNNLLNIDAAIKPVKTLEFIYNRIKLVRTGDDIGSGRSIEVL